MGRKKNSANIKLAAPKKAGKPHQTVSFEQLVGNANREALKPYIHSVMGEIADDLSQRVFRQQANIQTRLMAVEELLCQKLGITEDEIVDMVALVEDDATGYQLADRPAKETDLVRLSLRTRPKGEQYGDQVRRQVTSLMIRNSEGQLSLGSAQVEGALIGMSSGDVKEVVLEDEFTVELRVDRVSEKRPQPAAPVTLAAPQTESAPNENQDA